MAKKALLLVLVLVFAGSWSQPMLSFACPFAGQTEICRDAVHGEHSASLAFQPASEHDTPVSSHSAAGHGAHASPQPASGPDQVGVFGMEDKAETLADVAASVKFCDMQTCGQLCSPLASEQFTRAAFLPGVEQATHYRDVWSSSLRPSGIFHPPSHSSL